MAEGKKSFLLYCDMIHMVSKLPDDVAGKLLKHILEYVNDKNPQTDDVLIQVAFEPIKQSLKRDLKKYQQKSEKARESAFIRWNANASERKKGNANNADSDSDSDSDSVNDSDKNKIPMWQEFFEYAVTKKPNVDQTALKMKYESWIENGWKTGGDKPRKILNWKGTLLNTLPHIAEKTKKVTWG